MASSAFLTYLIICPVSFFLGIIFTNWAFDHAILWRHDGATALALSAAETHYAALFHAPMVMRNTMHTVVVIGFIGIIAKLYKPTESNTLFDGGSLVLYMVALIMYLTNIRTGLASANANDYGELSQRDGLQVIAATQVITALALLGVLLLQAGQFYAELAQQREETKLAQNLVNSKKKEDKKHR